MRPNDLIERYGVSIFDQRDHHTRGPLVMGSAVPVPVGDELVRALLSNVEQSKEDVTTARARAHEARQDGLVDPDMFHAADRKTQERWTGAIRVVGGDLERAQSELRHWREYVSWALGQRPATDARLPPEREPGEEG